MKCFFCVVLAGCLLVSVLQAAPPRGISDGKFTLYITNDEFYVRKGPLKYGGKDKYKPGILNVQSKQTPAIFYATNRSGRPVAYDFLNSKQSFQQPNDQQDFISWAKQMAPFEK
ncbi:unnamed protein product [Bursaphelenchus okinawaensis]|uniref:Uncharacterized protein n=1 Tax=Bursaphelenchus okinawaensis TaxID=465554 RepID=A0A811L1X1_9BILA|nr:unnamed protein product [Bursaphelenchus okinawaensis]CAG9115006.1 unnamed protein product [Bursaphelenchus okinawaensis]